MISRVLWRACNLTSFSPGLTGPVDYPFTRLLPVTRDPGSNPLGGVLMWDRDSPVSIVSLHWWPRRDWSFLWPRLRWAKSRTITRPSCLQCDNPTWSHTALLSQFHARCRSPFRLHNLQSRLLGGGGALWIACNLTSFSPCHWSSGLPVCFPSQGTRVQIPWGVLMWNRDSPVSIVSLQYDDYFNTIIISSITHSLPQPAFHTWPEQPWSPPPDGLPPHLPHPNYPPESLSHVGSERTHCICAYLLNMGQSSVTTPTGKRYKEYKK